jgi:hypothetical protein
MIFIWNITLEGIGNVPIGTRWNMVEFSSFDGGWLGYVTPRSKKVW